MSEDPRDDFVIVAAMTCRSGQCSGATMLDVVFVLRGLLADEDLRKICQSGRRATNEWWVSNFP
jgi:hypothetical protein